MNTALNPIERLARSLYSARKMAKPVNFVCDNPDAHSVSLLGDLNGWNPNSHAMRRQPNGRWFVQSPLTHGHPRIAGRAMTAYRQVPYQVLIRRDL
jgi:1,4-alpha-glucan branching enzyme